jgi:RND superfamily putative drug exporter
VRSLLALLVVLFWIGAAVVATMELPSIEDAQTGALGDLVPTHADALDAELISKRRFAFPLLSRTLVVVRDAKGLSAAEQVAVARQAVAATRGTDRRFAALGAALPVLNTRKVLPFARERGTTAVTYLFYAPEVDGDVRTATTERYVAALRAAVPGAFVAVTGALAARDEQFSIITGKLPLIELLTVLLVGVAVALHFRALGAPLLTLATVGIAYLISVRLAAFVGQKAGVSVPSEVQPVIVVLLFGVITDYSIFFLDRFRRLLRDGEERPAAAGRTNRELRPIIATAGLTVVLGSASLLVARLGFFQAFGPGIAMAVLLALVVVLTFIPAVLRLAGGWLYWPSRPAPLQRALRDTAAGRGRSRAVRVAARHPAPVAILSTLVLLGAAYGLLGLRLGNPLIRGLPDDLPVQRAYTAAAKGFAPGVLSPTVMLVQRQGIVGEQRALRRVQRWLAAQPGVAGVLGPAQQPSGRALGGVLARNGDAARYVVVLEEDPLGGRGIQSLRRLQARVPAELRAAGIGRAQASFAGDTALVAETIDKTNADLGRIAPAIGVAVVLVLGLFLRALVAPLYLLLASGLALLGALGLTTWIFQGLLGHAGITYYVPIAGAVLLVSLGSDYNVFLVGRIWQESEGRSVREAVIEGGSRAAASITVAGIVLGLSFALLAIVPIQAFRELAVLMALGVLLDAFVVRTLLVPALIALVGRRSAWPGHGLGRGSPTA